MATEIGTWRPSSTGSAASLELAGGVVSDASIARAAAEADAERLVTLNPKDVRRAWPEAGKRIVGP